MWIFTKTGFYSIVNDSDDSDRYVVRARLREDLVDFITSFSQDHEEWRDETIDTIQDGGGTDYRWRVSLYKGDVREEIYAQMHKIDYATNVKDNIDKGDDDRHASLLRVWSAMAVLQDGW
jgi:hypothetical protein